MLTDNEIDEAKKNTIYRTNDHFHEHNDCIRIAYEWLDAQNKIKSSTTVRFCLKHIIEKWAGRYDSESDVKVAAFMHPKIYGKYPTFNISTKLMLPSKQRLSNIPEAFTQMNYCDFPIKPNPYRFFEDETKVIHAIPRELGSSNQIINIQI